MRLFIDNCLPPRFARTMHSFYEEDGHEFVHLRSRFDHDPGDTAWMPQLVEEGGWCVMTNDRGISRKPRERETWMGRPVIVFFLAPGWDHLRLGRKQEKLFGVMDEIIDVSKTARPGTGYAVRVNSTVVRLFEGRFRR